jgi:hypothetical protein
MRSARQLPATERGRTLTDAAPIQRNQRHYGFFVKSTVGASRAAAFVTSK